MIYFDWYSGESFRRALARDHTSWALGCDTGEDGKGRRRDSALFWALKRVLCNVLRKKALFAAPRSIFSELLGVGL
jgi:hypothetical protein